MLHLDSFSCVLTVLSTLMIGRRWWQGWIVAAANSLLICAIALRAAQPGFIVANIFCLGIYGYNLFKWRTDEQPARRSSSARQRVRVYQPFRRPQAQRSSGAPVIQ